MLKLKAEAMQQLRLRLPETAPTRLPKAFIALLYTETWCRNTEAAAVHIRLLEVINNNHGLDVDDLIAVLYSDVQRASMTLESTRFLMEDKYGDILETDYVQNSETEREIEVDLTGSLHQLLVHMRQALLALDVLQASESTKSVRQAATIKCLRLMSFLLDNYNLSSNVVEKYMALAALYRIRREANIERIRLCGITIFHSGSVLIPRLRELLVAASNDPPALHLWALSVGIMSGDCWFRQEYRRHLESSAISNSKDLGKDFEHRGLGCSAGLLFDDALEAAENI